MAKKDTLAKAEALVRKVVTKNFKQQIDQDTLRVIAKKILRVVEDSTQKKPSGSPKKAA